MLWFLLVFALAALTVVLPGCGGDNQGASQARAEEEFCASLKDLGADIEAVLTLDQDERQAAMDAIQVAADVDAAPGQLEPGLAGAVDAAVALRAASISAKSSRSASSRREGLRDLRA